VLQIGKAKDLPAPLRVLKYAGNKMNEKEYKKL
jgi:hypothetical protein